MNQGKLPQSMAKAIVLCSINDTGTCKGFVDTDSGYCKYYHKSSIYGVGICKNTIERVQACYRNIKEMM